PSTDEKIRTMTVPGQTLERDKASETRSSRQSKSKTAAGKKTKSTAMKRWRKCHHFMERIKESEQVWRRKMQSEDLEFEYVLKKDSRLIVSTYREGNQFADFFVKVRVEQDVEEVLSIIKGLKPRKRR